MKTIEEVMQRHGTYGHQYTASGLLCVRDHVQRLWFYYELRNGEYRATESTRTHPKFYR
jgi:hypothetical protein